jgi:hypothetical protein
MATFPQSPWFTGAAKRPIATAKIPFRLKPAYHGSRSNALLIRPSGLPSRSA